MLFLLATVAFCQIEKPKVRYVLPRSVREREETVTFLNIAPDCNTASQISTLFGGGIFKNDVFSLSPFYSS